MGNCGAKKSAQKDIEAGPPSEATLRKKAELQDVLDADGIKRQEEDAWYVVEAAWVQRWLAYVQGGDDAKKPGPIMNENLLVHDKAAGKWVPKELLRAARKEHMGHYRRVNPHVWREWATRYPGSGPAIWVESEPYEDSSNWQLDPSFNGVTKGRSGRGFGVIQGNGGGGGGHQGREGGMGVDGGGNGGGHGAGDGADGAWEQQPIHGLAIGEMEDDGIGEETTAKAAAFFDVALNSPSTSWPRDAAADAPSGTIPGASPVPPITAKGDAGGGGDGKIERQSTAAEMWMYGDVDGVAVNGAAMD